MQDGIQSIEDLALENQRVFIRADLDLSLDDPSLAVELRFRGILPTLEKARSAGARIVIGSNLGRPGGRVRPELSMDRVGLRLCELLKTEIYLPDESIGDAARKVVQDLRPGQICLLENLGFYAEEQQNDEGFSRSLAALVDVFVNDAPRTVHERWASTVGLPLLTRQRAAGELLSAERATFAKLREPTGRPFVALIGGAGTEDRFALIEWLVGKVDALCIAGVLGNTLACASGAKLGASLVEDRLLARGRTLLASARERRTALVLPSDFRVADRIQSNSGDVALRDALSLREMALDIGPQTIESFAGLLRGAKTVLIHGALGAVENPVFAAGTREILLALTESSGFVAVGGDRLMAALQAGDPIERVNFIHSGCVGCLGFLAGHALPGLEVLRGGNT